jgi:hypothetical protein
MKFFFPFLFFISKGHNILELVSGKWKIENGKWKMENGKWKKEKGKWKMEKTDFSF